MLRTTLLSTAILLTVAGCARLSESRINPLNWFGGSRNVVSTPADPANRTPLVPTAGRGVIVDNRPFVTSITALSVDRSPTGAIVRATAIAPTQGFFNAELVFGGVENGVLLLNFRVQAPQVSGTPRSREINAGYVIDAAQLAGIRSIRVQGATNARTASR